MVLRKISRPLVAAPFIAQGLDAVRHPSEHIGTARVGLSAVSSIANKAPGAVTVDADVDVKTLTTLIRAHGAATVAAGGLLALGKFPRLAGLTLAALTAPLVVANEPFGKAHPLTRAERRPVFFTRLSQFGAALLVAADTGGKPSLKWRFSNARERREAQRAKAD